MVKMLKKNLIMHVKKYLLNYALKVLIHGQRTTPNYPWKIAISWAGPYFVNVLTNKL